MNKAATYFAIGFLLVSSINVNCQSNKNVIKANALYYFGFGYERIIGSKNSINVSINRHDWNYVHLHDNLTLIKSQVEYRMYKEGNVGLYIAPTLTYRYRNDPSIGGELDISSLAAFGGLEEKKKYAIKLHSGGLGLTGGYQSQAILKRLSIDISMRLAFYVANYYKMIKEIIRIENTNNITLSDNVSEHVKKTISKRIRPEIALSVRIGYNF